MEKPVDSSLIHCHRTGQDYTASEHRSCPYCWGSKEAVQSGEHKSFCDFKPGEDPINFGFPADGNRIERS